MGVSCHYSQFLLAFINNLGDFSLVFRFHMRTRNLLFFLAYFGDDQSRPSKHEYIHCCATSFYNR